MNLTDWILQTEAYRNQHYLLGFSKETNSLAVNSGDPLEYKHYHKTEITNLNEAKLKKTLSGNLKDNDKLYKIDYFFECPYETVLNNLAIQHKV